jgi:hypothetical protein
LSLTETELALVKTPGDMLIRWCFGILVTAAVIWISQVGRTSIERSVYRDTLNRLGNPSSYDISHEPEVVHFQRICFTVDLFVYLSVPWLGFVLFPRRRRWVVSYVVFMYLVIPLSWFAYIVTHL